VSTTFWVAIGLVALVTFAIKAAGPVALGGRDLPPWFVAVIRLLAPALLTALVVTSALADGDRLAVGADTAGVAVAGVAMWRGASVLAGVAIAVGLTAGLRALGA
jgi:branched-subunit amino acid transport protein